MTYRITSIFVITDSHEVVKAVFPSFNGERVVTNPGEIFVTFDTEQTPADLGPLVKVERVDSIPS